MKWKYSARYFLAAAFFVVFSCSGCALHPEPSFDRSGIAMDTAVSLRAAGKEAKEAVDESFARIAELDALASSQNPDSDVSKINAAAGSHYVSVDPAIYEMIDFAKSYSVKSQGSWDISVGVVTNLWQIGNEGQHVPSPEEIQSVMEYVGYEYILLRPEDHAVMLAKTGMSIDLGGVAKGYAVDEVRKIYEAHGIKSGLINMGASSMYAVGQTGKGRPWNIGIKHPRSDESGNYLGIVRIENQALSTSGDYERYFIQDGVRYHHIFDPATGYPADSEVMSDSIVIDGAVEHAGMLSDILTTVIFVLGPQKGLEFVNSVEGVECEITGTDGRIYTTEGFRQQFFDINNDFQLVL